MDDIADKLGRRAALATVELVNPTVRPAVDPVNHPEHYTFGSIEPIDAIEAWKLPFHLGNAVKYIARHAHKHPDDPTKDLLKAVWMVKRYIKVLEASKNGNKS